MTKLSNKKVFARIAGVVLAITLIALLAALFSSVKPFYASADEHFENDESNHFSVSNEQDIIEEGTFGTCSWSINDEGLLSIWPTSGSEGTLGTESGPWTNFKAVKKVYIEEGVFASNDNNHLFANLANCESFEIGNLNTSNLENMSYFFAYCDKIKSIDMSKLNLSNVVNVEGLFYACHDLENVDGSKFADLPLVSINFMFYECWMLKDVDVSNFYTSNLKETRSVFYECSSMKTIDLSKWDMSKVQVIKYMFARCGEVENIYFPSNQILHLNDMESTFSGCVKLKNIDLSIFDTALVTSMNYLFQGCSTLTTIDISNFDVSNVIYATNMFDDCENLKTIISSDLNFNNATSMAEIFNGCKNLENIDCSKIHTNGLNDFECAFLECSSIKFIDLSNMTFSPGCTMSRLFEGCTSLKKVQFTSSDLIHPMVANDMFANCSQLEVLDLTVFNTRNTNIENMFLNTTQLKKIKIGEDFSFEGDSNSRQCSFCVPPKSGYYIGKWQDSNGTIYDSPEDIPSYVANEYTWAIDFDAYKYDAKSKLNDATQSAINTINSLDNLSQWKKQEYLFRLNSIQGEGNADIDQAEDIEEVDNALSNALSQINNVVEEAKAWSEPTNNNSDITSNTGDFAPYVLGFIMLTLLVSSIIASKQIRCRILKNTK